MFHLNFKRSGIFQVYFILNSRMMWISKTISLSTDIQQIMASTCNQNPNLHIFFHGAKLLKGQRSFWPPGKRRGWFFFHQKLEQLQKTPNLNSLVEADLWKNISSQKLFEAQNNHFLNTKKRWILFGKAPKKIKKKGPFLFQFLCTCKRGPKVRRTAAQYLESHKQTIRDVISDQRKLYVLLFFHNDFKNWDLGHLNHLK